MGMSSLPRPGRSEQRACFDSTPARTACLPVQTNGSAALLSARDGRIKRSLLHGQHTFGSAAVKKNEQVLSAAFESQQRAQLFLSRGFLFLPLQGRSNINSGLAQCQNSPENFKRRLVYIKGKNDSENSTQEQLV